MRVPLAACALVFSAVLGGCTMPRPWLAPHAWDVCPSSTAPLTGEVLVATFRASTCSKGNPRWTAYRSPEPLFSAVDTSGGTRIADRQPWLDELDRRAPTGHAPVIYIHGYFNDQAEALRRAYAIRTLLCKEGQITSVPMTCAPQRPVIALTWPSYNGLAKYTWDEANSEWTQAHAARLILDIAERHPGTILIAHSMGNRILIAAALEAAAEGRSLDRLVLASPDVDRQYLAELLEQPQGLGYPATLYASRKDQALSASWRTHGNPRAGDLSYWASGHAPAFPYRAVNRTDVVDTTALHAGPTGHAAFVETPEAAADLCHVLAGQPSPARKRDYLYWTLAANGIAGDPCEQRAREAVAIATSSLKRFRR